MIVDALVGLLVTVLRSILDLVPVWSPNLSGFNTTGLAAGNALGLLNEYFPVAVLGICLLTVLGTKAGLSLWHIVVFVYDRFPLKFT